MVGVGMIHQHHRNRWCMVCLVTPWCAAKVVRDWVPVAHWMNKAMVAVFLLWVWVLRVKECPQWVQRQRVVDLLVVPFSLCCCRIVGSWGGWWSSFNPTGVRLAQMWPEVRDGVGNSFRGAILW